MQKLTLGDPSPHNHVRPFGNKARKSSRHRGVKAQCLLYASVEILQVAHRFHGHLAFGSEGTANFSLQDFHLRGVREQCVEQATKQRRRGFGARKHHDLGVGVYLLETEASVALLIVRHPEVPYVGLARVPRQSFVNALFGMAPVVHLHLGDRSRLQESPQGPEHRVIRDELDGAEDLDGAEYSMNPRCVSLFSSCEAQKFSDTAKTK